MLQITKDQAKEIAMLALGCNKDSFNEYYDIRIGGLTISKHMNLSELLLSVFVIDKENSNLGLYKESGYHINIMKNMDIFMRAYPYYDGIMDNLYMVNDQVKIQALISSYMPIEK